jgi:hypothetical protein
VLLTVSSFIDLVGASGAAYRFRRLSEALTAIGGNFVYVREQGEEKKVVCCGKTRSLWRALNKPVWASDENSHPDDHLYIRLNAASGARDKDHDDLIAGLPRPFVIYEMD